MERRSRRYAEINKEYQHFSLFKQTFEKYPYSMIKMLEENASQEFKDGELIERCNSLFWGLTLFKAIKDFTVSVAAVYLGTILLHRRRSLALTSMGGADSLLLKYLPCCLGYTAYDFYKNLSIRIEDISLDFKDFNDQFYQIYQSKGQKYLQQRHWQP